MGKLTDFLKLYLPAENDVYNEEKDQNENFEKIDKKIESMDKNFLPRGNTQGSYAKTAYDLDKEWKEEAKDIKDNRWRLYSKEIGNPNTETDLDTITDVGWYHSKKEVNKFKNNLVGTGAFTLKVESIDGIGNSHYIRQTFFKYINFEIFCRLKIGSTWTAIKKISDDLSNYWGKDTFESLAGIFNGNVGIYLGAGNEINFTTNYSTIVFNYRKTKSGKSINNFVFFAGEGSNGRARIEAGDIESKGRITSNGKEVALLDGTYDYQQIGGAYSGDGGKQPPSYVGSGKVRFLMSNEVIGNDTSYKDFMYMDTYTGGDVGYTTAFGIGKNSSGLRAFLMRGKKGGATWEDKAEIYHTSNLNWETLAGKPTTFPPNSHTHDDRYFTEAEVNAKIGAIPIRQGIAFRGTANAFSSFKLPATWQYLFVVMASDSGYSDATFPFAISKNILENTKCMTVNEHWSNETDWGNIVYNPTTYTISKGRWDSDNVMTIAYIY